MIGGEQSVDIDTDAERLWSYMTTFDNWADYVVGYEKFVRVDDTRTVWTLRGDVGILSRAVDIQVDLVEQIPGEMARFELTGLTERLTGTGSFRVQPLDGDQASSSTTDAAAISRPSWWRRFLFRFLTRRGRKPSSGEHRPDRQHDDAARRDSHEHAPHSSTTPAGTPPAGAARSRLTFTLEVSPGGPMAPMVEMLMAPMLQPAADDICEQIRNALGGQHADS